MKTRSVIIPKPSISIRVVFFVAGLRVKGRACAYDLDKLYFTPDGYTSGFVVEAEELGYESTPIQIMREPEIERATRMADSEYRRMFLSC